ncbi:hypothetical protein X777_14822 [Ooceraea biroi]|uniref:Uncharacterized protein n=1 Tax=Ooceraea biroi TaxID=2015173 RepID=A0A026WRU6_OOCBI|nr:hypothetical protein X777_14822 [Ooceraea biroi]
MIGIAISLSGNRIVDVQTVSRMRTRRQKESERVDLSKSWLTKRRDFLPGTFH